MARTLTDYKIFIASPGGLEIERREFKNVVLEYNGTEANFKLINFTPIGWEDTIAGLGRPQSIINEEIKACDYFILVLHDRWGSNPSKRKNNKYTSGTEEEFHLALDCRNDENLPLKDIIVLFKSVNERQLSDPGSQLEKVLNFRKQREKEKDLLYDTFDSLENFSSKIRKFISHWKRNIEEKPGKEGLSINITSNNIIRNTRIDFTKESPGTILKLAEELAASGENFEAEEYFSHSIVDETFSWGYAKFGKFLRRIGQLQRSRHFLEKAVEISNKQSDYYTEAYANRQLGRVYEHTGDLQKALDYYYKALALYNSIDDPGGKGRTYRDLGLVLKKRGRLEEALTNLEHSRAIYSTLNDDEGLATVLGYTGLVYKSLGQLGKAKDCYKSSLSIHREIKNDKAIPILNSNIGVVKRIEGDYKGALKEHNSSLEYYLKMDDKQGIAREYSNIGVVYRLQKDLAKAVECHNKSLQFSEEIGNYHGIAIQYGNLGFISKLSGNLNSALSYYKKSLEFSQKVGDKKGIAIQFKNIGAVYSELKNFDKAEKSLNEARNIEEPLNAIFELSFTYLELGKLYNNIGKKELSIEYLDKAKRNFESFKQKKFIKEIEELIDQITGHNKV